MPKRWVKLTFPGSLIKRPVTFQVAVKHKLTANIRRAKVTATAGELVLELIGTQPNLEKGLKAFAARGVKVEPVTGNILE